MKLRALAITLVAGLGLLVSPTEVLAVVQSLNGQTGQTQTFQNDSNVIISSLNNVHSLNWQGLLPLSRGGTGISSLISGSVLFSNGINISQDNSNLFWDDSNNRLGIATSSPTVPLDVSGTARATSLVSTSDSTINSLTIGLGGGSVPSGTAVGKNALLNANSSSYGNTAVGYNAFMNAGSSGDSTALGFYALAETTNGDSDTAIGSGALRHNTTGRFNTAVGSGAMYLNETGEFNTSIGTDAFAKNYNGSNNVAIGFRAGYWQADGSSYLTSPENSIYIGQGARGYDNNDYNSIVIGNATVGAGPNTTVIGSGAGAVYFGSAAGLASIHGTTLFLGSSTRPGCIVMGDSDGNGVTYIIVNDGVISASTTKPTSLCE